MLWNMYPSKKMEEIFHSFSERQHSCSGDCKRDDDDDDDDDVCVCVCVCAFIYARIWK